MADKWYVHLTNESTGETVYLQASTEQALKSKIDKQQLLWKKKNHENELEKIRLQAEELIVQYKDGLQAYRNIIKLGLNGLTYHDFYKLKPEDENIPVFELKLMKPELDDIYKELNLPLKRTLFDKISKKAVVKRENREKLALETLNSRLRDFEIQLNSETENYNSYRLKKTKENIDHNNDLTRRKDLLLRKDKEEIESLLEAFINTLIYIPANNEKANIPDFEVQFQAGKDVLIVSRKLPSKVVLPKFSDIKWNKRNNDIEMVKWKDKEFHQFHEDVIFQISLLTIKHIFEFSPQEVIKRVVFNGWIDYVNSSTGRDESACIISLDVERDNFMNINLDKVDYKNCIKGLKGIISPDFINMLPVQPKLDLDRTDRRFINSKDVSEKLENGFNLAVMEWEEFEYLIRQLFSKIFTYENSEVKITQASRDGGVDAIAFDPDPIRGGKFIIQAKRYNILVPVSAVRDLYGTILHEGATRGILVTTSEYGRDAYMFAKDKPITLINGQELLSLLHQHGFNDVTIVLKKNQTL